MKIHQDEQKSSKIPRKKQKLCVFKINFLHDKKYLSSNFFDNLEFSYTFDLAHSEHPRRFTDASRLTHLTGERVPKG